jgi:NTE family protein
VVFRRGLLWAAVLASMAIPGIYPPLSMGPYTLVDGGVLNPVPVDVAAAMGADVVIAVKLSRRPTSTAVTEEAVAIAGRVPPMVHTVMRAIEIMQSKIGTHAVAAATIQIEPDLGDIADPGLRRFSQAQRFVAPGERAAEAALPRLAAALPWLRPPARVE